MTASVPRDQIVDADDNVIVDNVLIDYDYEKYNFGDWIRGRMHEAGYDVTDLTKIHEVIPYDELQNFQIKLIRETARPDFKEILHPFVHEVLEPVFGAEIATQRFSNIRLFLPNRSEMKLAYHTGVWYGHGLGQATCWMPFTPVKDSNSMLVVSREDSVRLMKEAEDNDWDQEKMQEEFDKYSWFVEAKAGQAHLFNQEIIHGNATNETPISRVSIDFRLCIKNGKLCRKRVGGYFTLLDPEVRGGKARTREEDIEPGTKDDRGDYTCIGYVNNSTLVSSGIPIVLQRLMMGDYMKDKGLSYTYQQLENEAFPYLPTLKNIVKIDKPNDAILYSIYSLPDRADFRKAIYQYAIDNKVTLHFANEDMRLRNQEDADWVEANIAFAKNLPVAKIPEGV